LTGKSRSSRNLLLAPAGYPGGLEGSAGEAYFAKRSRNGIHCARSVIGDAAENKLRARRAKKLRIYRVRRGLARPTRGRSRKQVALYGWIGFFSARSCSFLSGGLAGSQALWSRRLESNNLLWAGVDGFEEGTLGFKRVRPSRAHKQVFVGTRPAQGHGARVFFLARGLREIHGFNAPHLESIFANHGSEHDCGKKPLKFTNIAETRWTWWCTAPWRRSGGAGGRLRMGLSRAIARFNPEAAAGSAQEADFLTRELPE